MGLDIYVSVTNRKELEKNRETNKAIEARNDAIWQKEGENGTYEQPVQTQLKQDYYFRKVNCLIEWVEHAVGEVENCTDIELTKEHIEMLHEDVMSLTKENCEDVMPTRSGFFFGSTDYDDWYWSDIDDIKAMTTKILAETNWDEDVVIFYAWW